MMSGTSQYWWSILYRPSLKNQEKISEKEGYKTNKTKSPFLSASSRGSRDFWYFLLYWYYFKSQILIEEIYYEE